MPTQLGVVKATRRLIHVVLLLTAMTAPASSFEFALIGDTPYNPEDSLALLRMIPRINAADVEFVDCGLA